MSKLDGCAEDALSRTLYAKRNDNAGDNLAYPVLVDANGNLKVVTASSVTVNTISTITVLNTQTSIIVNTISTITVLNTQTSITVNTISTITVLNTQTSIIVNTISTIIVLNTASTVTVNALTTASTIKIADGFVIPVYDEIDITYVGTGSSIETVTYYKSTVSLCTLTLSYTSSNLTKVVKT